MKKSILAFTAVGLLAVFTSSCEKAKALIFPSFEAAAGEAVLNIPVISNTTTEATVGSTTMNFNLDSTIKANTAGEFSISHAESVIVKNIVLEVLNGDQESNISNFESVKVSLSSNSNTTPATLVSTTLVDVNQPQVINGNGTELKEYLKGSTLTYNVAGKLRRETKKNLQLQMSLILSVK